MLQGNKWVGWVGDATREQVGGMGGGCYKGTRWGGVKVLHIERKITSVVHSHPVGREQERKGKEWWGIT